MPGRRISIITDFGCRRSCPYCVWREHRLAGRAGVAGWDDIEAALAASPCGSVPVSGGGDPLYGDSRMWWREFLAMAGSAGKAVHVHTREIPPRSISGGLAKVVFSTEYVAQVPVSVLRDVASNGTAVRLAKVVLPDTSREEALRYLDIAGRHGWQLTFKELVGDGGPVARTPFRELEAELSGSYSGLRFLAGGDYNDYLMPDGYVYTRFRALPEDRREP